MKKITFLMLIISVIFTIISCSGSSGGDTETGYVDPGDWTGKDVKTNKAYTFANYPDNSGQACLAIIYQNTLGENDYLGIAAKETGFDLKIYCSGYSSIPLGLNTLSACTIVINSTTTNNASIGVDIDDNLDGSYTIVFTADVTGTNIKSGDTITAVKYP